MGYDHRAVKKRRAIEAEKIGERKHQKSRSSEILLVRGLVLLPTAGNGCNRCVPVALT